MRGALRGFRLPPVVVGEVKRPLEPLGVIGGIVGDARGCLVREGVHGNKIPPAHLHRVQTQVPGNHVQASFHTEGRLRSAGAPVGAGGSLVGDCAYHLQLNRRDVVGAGNAAQGVKGG